MPAASDLLAGGLPSLVAQEIGNTTGTVTPAGTNQATAASLAGVNHANITSVGSGTGVILPGATGSPIHAFFNADGANDLKVYAALTETINNSASATAFTVTHGKAAFFIPCKNLWIALQA